VKEPVLVHVLPYSLLLTANISLKQDKLTHFFQKVGQKRMESVLGLKVAKMEYILGYKVGKK
jgi:hypothetical protein